jgi:hypothetical protein
MKKKLTVPEIIKRSQINGFAALLTAEATPMRKLKGEYDTEFVKRIVCTYINTVSALGVDAIDVLPSLRSEAAAEAPISAESANPNTPPERAKGGE